MTIYIRARHTVAIVHRNDLNTSYRYMKSCKNRNILVGPIITRGLICV